MKNIIFFIPLLQIYASAFSAIILGFFPGLLSYKQFVIILGVCTSLVVGYYFFQYVAFRQKILKTLLVSLAIIFLYKLTSSFYIIESDKYQSFFLVLIGQFLPISLLSTICSYDLNLQIGIKKTIPFVAILFTITAFFAAFFPNSATSGGYAYNENGLNYQSISYLAAYATSMSVYYIITQKKFIWFFFNKKQWVFLFFALLIINLLTILIAGGRGGLVLFVILICYLWYYLNKYSTKDHGNKIFYNIIIAILIISIIAFCFYFAANSSIYTNGFSRILSFLQYGDSNGRNELRETALATFWGKPILGHGLGSVFYEIGEYTHNILTDILVEMGILGFLISIGMFIKIIKKLRLIISEDVSNCIWSLIFLDGLVMSLFSGYYLATCPLIWTLFFALYSSSLDSNNA